MKLSKCPAEDYKYEEKAIEKKKKCIFLQLPSPMQARPASENGGKELNKCPAEDYKDKDKASRKKKNARA
jgi:hypothetical protein